METSELANLQEIPLPPQVSYLPQTIAWYILFAIVAVLMIWVVWRWLRWRKTNQYRKAALRRLQEIELCLQSGDQHRGALAELPALVKQTALAFAPRKTVAHLSGDPWLRFLDSTYKDAAFCSTAGQLLPELSYRSPAGIAGLRDEEVAELIALVRKWIRKHRKPS